jgi:hypothetical protein
VLTDYELSRIILVVDEHQDQKMTFVCMANTVKCFNVERVRDFQQII